jgi:Translation initiation factor IF-3, N-terminal domain
MAIKRQRRREEPAPVKLHELSLPVDDAIESETVRLVGDGVNLIMDRDEAIGLARKKGLQLVQVSKQRPPVCRIEDYKMMQRQRRDEEMKRVSKLTEEEQQVAKMKAVRVGCASHGMPMVCLCPFTYALVRKARQRFGTHSPPRT